jgi:HNH endonuclease
MTREERFWTYVDKQAAADCWEWMGGYNEKGYGIFAKPGGGSEGAHRFSYRVAHGNIPDGLSIDHLCRNPPCVNPNHLEAVVGVENTARGVSFSVQNALKTHCLNGHELTAENSYGWKGRRQCKTCARERARAQTASPETKALHKARYAKARAAGLSSKDAAKASRQEFWNP